MKYNYQLWGEESSQATELSKVNSNLQSQRLTTVSRCYSFKNPDAGLAVTESGLVHH